jgi:hypothetical protein
LESGRGARGGACGVLAFLGGLDPSSVVGPGSAGYSRSCRLLALGVLMAAIPGVTGGSSVLAVLKQKKGKERSLIIDVLGRVELSSSVSAKSFGKMNFHLQPMS